MILLSSTEEPLPLILTKQDHNVDHLLLRILHDCDPNTFASLALLNSRFRALSQRVDLLSLQLSQCPSYAASHDKPEPPKDLLQLQKLFAREVKRNLFSVYLRPKETIIKLISNSISSSSAPGGDGMFFSASPLGQHILAYNSSRIYVIDLRGKEIDITRELKILRRPVSACIKDDGTLLAVLSSEMQIDLYDMNESPPKRKQSVILDSTPRSIAMSPCGSVIAAAYEGGIEVSSLNPGALPTDRRAVKCDAVDSLAFSFDGTQILGTTTQSNPSNTVILTAPFLDPGNPHASDDLGAMWTASILFPNASRDCSHALMLQEGSHEEAAWTFTYDRNYETFRAVRIDDLRNGSTYFTGPVPPKGTQSSLAPSAVPSATYHGDMVTALFQNKEVWLYGIPEDLEAVPPVTTTTGASTNLRRGQGSNASVSRRTSSQPHENDGSNPTWRQLSEQGRHTFVHGYKIAELAGANTIKFVSGFGDSSFKERLVIGASGISGTRLVTEEEDMDFVDGGRLVLFDFDQNLVDGSKTEITIEVGTDEAEPLEEEKRDLETDVAIVRRRTVAQKLGGRSALLRAATTASQIPDIPPLVRQHQQPSGDDDPLLPRRVGQDPATRSVSGPQDPVEEEEFMAIEQMEALDAPYSHASPRPLGTLRRAATAAARNRALHPRTADGRPIEYRRADGRREHPHESDADNWVPPPPPYQKDDPGAVPNFLRGPPVLAGLHQSDIPPVPPIPPFGGLAGQSSQPSPKQDVQRGPSMRRRPSHHRTASDSTTMSRPRVEDIARPQSTPSVHQEAIDLYDATPPVSPQESSLQIDDFPAPATTQYRAMDGTADASNYYPRPSEREVQHQSQDNEYHPSEPVLYKVSEEDTRPNLSLEMPRETTREMPRIRRKEVNSGPKDPNVATLVTAHTWPLVVNQAGPSSEMMAPEEGSDAPLSAPATEHHHFDDAIADLPPPPSSGQLESLNRRMSGGNPRRLSGSLLNQRPPSLGARNEFNRYSQHIPQIPQSRPSSSRRTYDEPDQPLIISTPGGIVDSLEAKGAQHNREPIIFAPIPRHPRPGNRANTDARPVVERLETIWSATSDHEAPLQPPQHRFLPAWMSTPNLGVVSGTDGDDGQPRRSMGGPTRSWNLKKKNKKSKDVRNTSLGRELRRPSLGKEQKDKKCVVM